MKQTALMGNQGAFDDLITHIKFTGPVFKEIFNKIIQVIGIEPGRMDRQRSGDVFNPADIDAAVDAFFSGISQGAVSPLVNGDVNDHGTRLHGLYHLPGNEMLGYFSGNKGAEDEDIGFSRQGRQCFSLFFQPLDRKSVV